MARTASGRAALGSPRFVVLEQSRQGEQGERSEMREDERSLLSGRLKRRIGAAGFIEDCDVVLVLVLVLDLALWEPTTSTTWRGTNVSINKHAETI